MAETTGRVLQLLGLLQSRRVWSGDQLAERLGVTTRSVQGGRPLAPRVGQDVMCSRSVNTRNAAAKWLFAVSARTLSQSTCSRTARTPGSNAAKSQ